MTASVTSAMWVVPVVAAALPLLVVTWRELWASRSPSSTCCDWAVLAIQSRDAIHGGVFVGPYSQYHWNHPGPLFAYWSVPFFQFAHGNFGGLGVASALANLLCVILIVVLAGRLGDDPTSRCIGRYAAAAVLLGFQFVFGLDLLRDPWNPLLIILPTALFIVSCVAFVRGRAWALVVAACAANFAMQTHLGSAPVIAATSVVTMILAVVRGRVRGRQLVGPVAVAAGLTVVAWALPVWQQLRGAGGNLGAIARYFVHGGPSAHPSLSEAVRVVFVQFGLTSRQLDVFVGPAQRTIPPLSAVQFAVPVVLMIVVIVGAVTSRASQDRWIRDLCVFAAVAMTVTLIAALRAGSPLAGYVMSSALSVGIVTWIVVVVVVVGSLRRIVVRGATSHRDPTGVTSTDGALAPDGTTAIRIVGSIVVAVAVLAVGGNSAMTAASLAPLGRARSYPGIATLSDATWRVVTRTPDRSVLVDIGGPAAGPPWAVAAGIANDLQRRGAHIEVPAAWVFTFGERHADDGRAETHILVVGKDLDAPTRRVISRPGVQRLAATSENAVYLLPPGSPVVATAP
ncbi:MAG: hypothetical protein JST73_11555 [Actinobacteria bacterium]|nr:hypothetical protein [Actinomycetota bacterium]